MIKKNGLQGWLCAMLLALLLGGVVETSKAQQRVSGDLNRPQLVKGSLKEINLIPV